MYTYMIQVVYYSSQVWKYIEGNPSSLIMKNKRENSAKNKQAILNFV